ncbi:hypothetical protein NA56DRAFT_668131 [Hyaloscypha hepaticicola]|uniref:Amine oxidase n=1 Tax=Hyaloscypha hepaticicola TaxID=2082293 RepID=A0A2J6QJ12_9HELO|nr:hypothetical protein NA56DRAFT_668131 [Hyaloscypha hepaticicola]
MHNSFKERYDVTSSSEEKERVIVGAGLSGSEAALAVQKTGLSYVVLEATDRVGGKTLSQPLASGKGVVDLDAVWLNEVTQPKIYALAKKYGVETVIQPSEGEGILEDTTGIIQRIADGQLSDITSILETEAAKLDIRRFPISDFDKLIVRQVLKQNGAIEDAFKFLETTVKGLLGVDANELSLFYLDYIKSEGTFEKLRSEESNGAQFLDAIISKGTAGELYPGSLFLHTKKFIISVPTLLYKMIDFSPALPKAKTTLTASIKLGYYAKTILIYEKPWWRDIGLRGSFFSFKGAVSFADDTSVDADGQYSITCFIVGSTGRKRSILYPIKRRQLYWIKLRLWLEMSMDIDQGAPSPVMGPNLPNKYADVLRAPCSNLHFLCTETAY